jgi:hypothetical protein
MEIDAGGREGISQVRARGGVGDNIVGVSEKVPGPIYL